MARVASPIQDNAFDFNESTQVSYGSQPESTIIIMIVNSWWRRSRMNSRILHTGWFSTIAPGKGEWSTDGGGAVATTTTRGVWCAKEDDFVNAWIIALKRWISRKWLVEWIDDYDDGAAANGCAGKWPWIATWRGDDTERWMAQGLFVSSHRKMRDEEYWK